MRGINVVFFVSLAVRLGLGATVPFANRAIVGVGDTCEDTVFSGCRDLVNQNFGQCVVDSNGGFDANVRWFGCTYFCSITLPGAAGPLRRFVDAHYDVGSVLLLP